MTDWDAIAAAIGSATRQPFRLRGQTAIGGGCINQAYRIDGQDGRHFFIKLNSADKAAMFAAEVAGLSEIASTNTIRVPQPITYSMAGKQCYLVLEHLEFSSHGNARLLGEQLAALHRCTGAGFGFSHDNFIGTTPQPNTWPKNGKADWVDFWREYRLGFQLRLAAQNGYGGQLQRLGEKLMDALPAFFQDYTPQPSLLHGDLWSGNHAFLADGTPTIFDPATYYGDRECDLAMTELFGGYPADFYAAYRAAYPLDAGYATRRDLYNLYHILNHANLFGGGYARQAEQMMQKLLRNLD
jgi:protein-ribulosamine 3-kinase